ncbi:MAG: hypothetical protein VX615_05720 [Planctomycetota bacterium]|nr:hypothetical protein [Planctomycetota bacterium]
MVFKLATILIASLCALEPVELIPVDAGVEDRGALSTSLFVEQKDLRQNQSFERLYKVEGSEDVYVRKAGGLKAIFRSSQYVNIYGREVPIVPAGTVYVIGAIRPGLVASMGGLSPSGEDSIIEPEQRTQQVKRTHVPAGVRSLRFVEDEGYRRKRLASFVLSSAFKQ